MPKLSDVMEPKASKDRPKKDTENRGELRDIRIDPAENGYSVRCCFDPEKKDPKAYVEPDDETYVFESAQAAADYVKMMLEEHEGYEAKEK